MKKILSVLLAIVIMTTLFIGCGEEPATETDVNNMPTVDVAPPSESVTEEIPDGTPAVDVNKEEEKGDDVSDVPESKPEENKPSKSELTKPETAKPSKPVTEPSKPATEPEKPSTTPAQPTTKPLEKPVEKPATEPEKPAEKPAVTPEKPAVNNAPTSKPEDKPVVKEYSINEVHTIIKNTYGDDYRPNVEIPRESLTDLFGINLDYVEEFIAEQPMISANIDTFIAIKAKSGKGQAVEGALDNYKNSLLDGAMMYPSNMPKAQAAKVVRHGDYVFLVMLGAAGDMEADESTQLSFAKAQVDKGVSAINNYFTK